MKPKRMTTILLALIPGISLILVWLSTPLARVEANPGVLYVMPGTGGGCTTWADACELQSALTLAQAGDEIWVAAGLYKPGTARTDTFNLGSGVALYGGFVGYETSRAQRDWQHNVTVLSGDIDNNDLTDPNGIVTTTAHIVGANAYHVVTIEGIVETARLDGFTITAGNANMHLYPYHAWLGGGMYNLDSNPTLANVTFSGNNAVDQGGGMYSMNSAPVLLNVTFIGNNAGAYGGGMTNDESSPTLTDVTFLANSAGSHGGGMYNGTSIVTLLNVTFLENHAGSQGGGMYKGYSTGTLTNLIFGSNSAGSQAGGMYNGNSEITLTNALFFANSAGAHGGGMYNGGTSTPNLVNVTFAANSAALLGGGMYNGGSSIVTLANAILWGNSGIGSPQIYTSDTSTTLVTYSNVQGGHAGTGNIDSDPLFANAAGGNLRLRFGSPSIDAGNNLAVPTGVTTDLDGGPRFVDVPYMPNTGLGQPPLVDMGAYEADFLYTFLPVVTR